MSSFSQVGNRHLYGDGDQRNVRNRDIENLDHYHEGNIKEHITDDQPHKVSVANRLIEEEERLKLKRLQQEGKLDPTLPATMHGNKPSRGAEIDKQLQEEDQAIMAKKGDALVGKHY